MLVDVARQLFARMGVDNTTMNDIAQASKKGRRTLYTYFKSKNDIYLAVVESELDHLYKMLQDVASKDLPADEKLMTFIYARLDAIKSLVFRNGTLRATFFRDIWRVEKVRKSFDIRETELIHGILDAGVEEGIFVMPANKIKIEPALARRYAKQAARKKKQKKMSCRIQIGRASCRERVSSPV